MKFGPIEKNIKYPGKSKYPFFYMQVGDSVFIKKEENDTVAMAENARNTAYAYGHAKGMKFAGKAYKDGIRIWRIE